MTKLTPDVLKEALNGFTPGLVKMLRWKLEKKMHDVIYGSDAERLLNIGYARQLQELIDLPDEIKESLEVIETPQE